MPHRKGNYTDNKSGDTNNDYCCEYIHTLSSWCRRADGIRNGLLTHVLLVRSIVLLKKAVLFDNLLVYLVLVSRLTLHKSLRGLWIVVESRTTRGCQSENDGQTDGEF